MWQLSREEQFLTSMRLLVSFMLIYDGQLYTRSSSLYEFANGRLRLTSLWLFLAQTYYHKHTAF